MGVGRAPLPWDPSTHAVWVAADDPAFLTDPVSRVEAWLRFAYQYIRSLGRDRLTPVERKVFAWLLDALEPTGRYAQGAVG